MFAFAFSFLPLDLQADATSNNLAIHANTLTVLSCKPSQRRERDVYHDSMNADIKAYRHTPETRDSEAFVRFKNYQSLAK